VIILSDGRFNKQNVMKYLAEAQEKRYLYIFVILDPPKDGKTDKSIMNLRSTVKE
jgi:23S rRNA G2069 N7-methylase RlmK/C1962 C5-methylase RlmI